MKAYLVMILGVFALWGSGATAIENSGAQKSILQVGQEVTLGHDAFAYLSQFNFFTKPFQEVPKQLILQSPSCQLQTGAKGVVEHQLSFNRVRLNKLFSTSVVKVRFNKTDSSQSCVLYFTKNPLFNRIFEQHSESYRLVGVVEESSQRTYTMRPREIIQVQNLIDTKVGATEQYIQHVYDMSAKEFVEVRGMKNLEIDETSSLMKLTSEKSVFYRVPQVQCPHEGMGCYPTMDVAVSVEEHSDVSAEDLAQMFSGLSQYDQNSVFVLEAR